MKKKIEIDYGDFELGDIVDCKGYQKGRGEIYAFDSNGFIWVRALDGSWQWDSSPDNLTLVERRKPQNG